MSALADACESARWRGTSDASHEGMVPRRAFLASALGSLAFLVGRRATAIPAAPTWKRDEKDPRWVQGQVLADAKPDAVFARLRNVPEWPRMFTDIKSMRVLERGGDRWRVRLETWTFDCGAHDYHVAFENARTARLWINAPGIDAIAYMRVLDGATPETSRVVYSLYVDARGVMGWFISTDQLRKKQEQMVVRYLADLERAFRSPAAKGPAA